MHIAFSVDNNYAQHLGVSLSSLLLNLKPGIEPHIYIVTEGLNDDNKARIKALQNIRAFSLHFLNIAKEDFKDFPLGIAHITIASYFRLKLPYLLPDLDKILYLDVDTIVDGDISSLWDITLTDEEWLAGALELSIAPEFLVTIGLNKDDLYYNCGVLLMNLKALRTHNLQQKCIDYLPLYGHAMRYLDQDILNYVCKGHFKLIDLKYNMVLNYHYHINKLPHYKSPYSVQTLQEAMAHPIVIHFTGSGKPWFYTSRSHFAGKYMDYIKQTPWKDYRYPDRTLKNIIAKYSFFVRQWRKRLFSKSKTV